MNGGGTEQERVHVDGCPECRAHLTGSLGATFDSQKTVERQGPADDVLTEGREVGVLRVVRRLGAGAMGTVYAAFDPRLEREVAIKVLHLGGDLLAEARLLARLNHPHVVAVHEVLSWNGRVVLVMERVNGQTLRQWQQSPGRTVAQKLAVLQQCAEGLAAAHAAGIVHRDFKPDNVLVDEQGRARLLDFGLAMRGGAGASLAGSPAYMALQQLRREPADARSDQFAWWVTVYEALTGRVPHDGVTLEELTAARARGEVELKGVPSWLRRRLLRGLSNEPAHRFDSMRAAARALEKPRAGRWLAAVAALAVAAGFIGGRETPCDAVMGVRETRVPALADARADLTRALAGCRDLEPAQQSAHAACLAVTARELDLAAEAVEGTEFDARLAARVLKRVRPAGRCERLPLPPASHPESDRAELLESLRAQLRFDALRERGDVVGAQTLAARHSEAVSHSTSPVVRTWAGLHLAAAWSMTGRTPDALNKLRELEGVHGIELREQTWVSLGRWLFECYASGERHCEVAERQARRNLALLDEPWAHVFGREVEFFASEQPPPVAEVVRSWRRLPGAEFEAERALVNELRAVAETDDRSRMLSALELEPTTRAGKLARLRIEVTVAAHQGDLARVSALLGELEALGVDLEVSAELAASRRNAAIARGEVPPPTLDPSLSPRTALLFEFGSVVSADPGRARALLPQLRLIAPDLSETERLAYEVGLERLALRLNDAALLEATPVHEGYELMRAWQLALMRGDDAGEAAVYARARAAPDDGFAALLLLEERLQAGALKDIPEDAATLRVTARSWELEDSLRIVEAFARLQLGQGQAACRVMTPMARGAAVPARQAARIEALVEACPVLGLTPWPK